MHALAMQRTGTSPGVVRIVGAGSSPCSKPHCCPQSLQANSFAGSGVSLHASASVSIVVPPFHTMSMTKSVLLANLVGMM